MEQFMMPVGPTPAGELPPGMFPPPAVASPVPMMLPPQEQLLPPAADAQLAAAVPQVLQEEGATGPSSSGMGFFDKLRTDPNLSQAMMMVGLRMMQGQKPGQDAAGMLGDAMMAGAVAHNMLSYNAQEAQRKDAELGMRKDESAARIAASNASTAASTQAAEFKAQLQPDEIKKAKLAVAHLKTLGEAEQAKALGDAIRNDPELVRRQLDDASRQSRAAASASGATAGAASANAESTRQETKLRGVLADPKATAEEKAAATKALQKGASPYGSKMSDLDARASALRKAYPELTEAEAYARAYEDSGDKKGQDFEALKALSQSADSKTAAWAEGELLKEAQKKSAKPGGQPAASSVVKIANEAEWKKLAPGTQYELPDGRKGIR